MNRVLPLIAFIVCAHVASGCARDAFAVRWDAERMKAERAYAARHYDEAIERLQLLEGLATNDRDRFDVRLRIADSLLGNGERERALEAFLFSARSAPDRAGEARAMLRVARLIYETKGEELDGLRAFIAIVDRYPDTYSARRAMDWIGQEAYTCGKSRSWLLAFYKERKERLRLTPASGHLQFRYATLLADTQVREEQILALEAFRTFQKDHPQSALWDDSVYLEADVLHTLGDYEEELEALSRILFHRERTYLVPGNYETTYYHRSQWRIAQVLWHQLGRLSDARDALKTFVNEYAFSKLYDDGLYQLAVLNLKLGQEDEARDALERLVQERPESRYVRRIDVLLQTGEDPGAGAAWSHRGESGEVNP